MSDTAVSQQKPERDQRASVYTLILDMRAGDLTAGRDARLTVLNPSGDPTIWGIVWRAVRWPAGRTLSVCFFRLRDDKLAAFHEEREYRQQFCKDPKQQNCRTAEGIRLTRKIFVRAAKETIATYFKTPDADFIRIAKRWETYGSLKFRFKTNGRPNRCDVRTYDVRVAFDLPNNHSQIGTLSLPGGGKKDVSYRRASLNINLLQLALEIYKKRGHRRRFRERQFRYLVLHEFGHALGFSHEHAHPRSGCRYRMKVLRDKHGNDGANRNFLLLKGKEARRRGVKLYPYDKKSVMRYAIPARFIARGSKPECYARRDGIGLAPNDHLSEKDKAMMRAAYPPSANSGTGFSQRREGKRLATLLQRYDRRIDRNGQLSPEQKLAAKAAMRRLTAKGR